MKTQTKTSTCLFCRMGTSGSRRCKGGHAGGQPMIVGKSPSSGWNRKKKSSSF